MDTSYVPMEYELDMAHVFIAALMFKNGTPSMKVSEQDVQLMREAMAASGTTVYVCKSEEGISYEFINTGGFPVPMSAGVQ